MKVVYVFLRDTLYHRLMAFFAACFYGFPSRRLTVIGVTGTKGKSTTVELIAHILESAGKKVAVSSSLRNTVSGMTMPGCFKLQRLLRQAICDGCEYAVIEVTSQGVVQSRHRFIRWAVAVFLNLTPEHVEAHGGFEKYRAAKVAFFEYAAKNLPVIFIVNKDDENARYFIAAAGSHSVISFGAEQAPSSLPGRFNGYNTGAALSVISALGIDPTIARVGADSFGGARGRMENIDTGGRPFSVVVDYAVTPDSLRAVYENFFGKNIIAVFGCTGGGRDTGKRPVMGRIAGEACAAVVLTDDDSYDEDTELIMAEIEAGLISTKDGAHSLAVGGWKLGENYWKITDRRAAIGRALSLAKNGDVVLVTGKGGDAWLRMKHGAKIPWSDQSVVRDILKSL